MIKPALPGAILLLFLIPAASVCCWPSYGSNSLAGITDTIIHGEPVLISDQFSFTEGPASDRHGNVYFTDQPNNKIWKYGINNRLSIFMDSAGRANGLYFDKKGNLIACADEHDQLWSISPDRKVNVLIKDFQGKRLNGPNDLWIDPKGGIYFTDPYYQRNYWKRTSPDIKGQNVYYLPPNAAVPVIVVEDMLKPNGIVGSPDGKHLFIADIEAGKTYQYDITSNGTLKNKKLFTNQGSDGITIDQKGNIYLTGKGVTVYNASGIQIGHIPIPQPWTSNVCFGGRHRNKLFITASTALYMVQMKVKGVK
jgi:gluconolactonase